MLAALTGVIHDRQGADCEEHNRGDDNCGRAGIPTLTGGRLVVQRD